jgi:hypothetical protein
MSASQSGLASFLQKSRAAALEILKADPSKDDKRYSPINFYCRPNLHAHHLSVPETIWTLIGRVGHHHSLLLVMGNEACDADSLASSVALAYSASMEKLGDVTPAGAIIAPVINIARQDLALRQDIVHMLKEASINSDDLLFYPEMPEVT